MRMTAEERAARAEQRKQARAAQWAQEQRDRSLMLMALRGVVANKDADPTIRTFAVYCLNRACGYSLLPYDLKFPGSDSQDDNNDVTARLRAKFAEELKAAESNT